jgi:hypothetical protein
MDNKNGFRSGHICSPKEEKQQIRRRKKLVGTNVMIKRSFALLLGAKIKYDFESESPYSPNRAERTIMLHICD